MIFPERILRGVRITEKAANLQVENKYTFEVDASANAIAVTSAVEQVYKVKVKQVNIINTKGKLKRSRMSKSRPGIKGKMKKAIVTLKAGETIQLA